MNEPPNEGFNMRSADHDLLLGILAADETAVDKALEEGANPNRRIGGTYPLHICAAQRRENYAAIARLLLLRGADANVPDDASLSPLHYAALTDNSGSLLRILLNAGARTHVHDRDGATPLDYAERMRHDVARTILRSFRTPHNYDKPVWLDALLGVPKERER